MAKPLNVLILGCDGYIGWPVTCELIRQGHSVMGIDAGFKRSHYQFLEPGTSTEDCSLLPLYSLPERRQRIPGLQRLWLKDIREKGVLDQAIFVFSPDVLIHLAEIGSRAFAMSGNAAAELTVLNNLSVLSTLISSIREHKFASHIVKLSTVEVENPVRDVCTATLCMASMMLRIACEVQGLRATEIKTGLVYGIYPKELNGFGRTRFDYDVYFGNVVHRFVAQALSQNPITVYGDGNQSIALTHLKDVVSGICHAVRSAVFEPGKPLVTAGAFRIENSCTQIMSVNRIAELVSKTVESRLFTPAPVVHIDNPRGSETRKPKSQNPNPHCLRLTAAEVNRLIDCVEPYIKNIKPQLVKMRDPQWRRN